MIGTKVLDHMGRERIIRCADDMNRLVDEVEQHRDHLANLMLSDELKVAIHAEQESDRLEKTYVPLLGREIERVQALLDADAADAHRRAKANAIRNRTET